MTSGGGPRSPEQQILIRRALALGIGALILILIVVGIHGCLSTRHKNALRDYNTHVASIVTENTAQMAAMFRTLRAGSKSPTSLQQSLEQISVVAANDAARARQISTPSEMSHAQSNLELALDLRSTATTTIAREITTALSGDSGSAAQNSINVITGQMQALLASDVVYSQRVQPLIAQELKSAGVSGQTTPPSKALTNFGWLDPTQVITAIGATVPAKGSNGKAAPGTHGHGLTDVKIGDVTLSTTATNTITHSSAPVFTVDFQNQGENDEVDVKVNVTIGKGSKAIHLTRTIPETKAGVAASAQIPVDQPLPKTPVNVHVSISKVKGEVTTSNNRADYTVVFQ